MSSVGLAPTNSDFPNTSIGRKTTGNIINPIAYESSLPNLLANETFSNTVKYIEIILTNKEPIIGIDEKMPLTISIAIYHGFTPNILHNIYFP